MDRPNSRVAALHRFQELAGAVALLAAVFVPAAIAAAADGPTAWLQIGDDPAAMLSQGGLKHREPTEYEQFRKTQAALIKSPNVLRAALNDPAIANLKLIRDQREPIDWLKDNLSVSFPLESEVIKVSLRAGESADAVKIVNAVVDSFLKNVIDAKRQEVAKTYELLSQEVRQNRADILERRTVLEKLAAQLELGPQKAELLHEQYSQLLELSTDLQKRFYDTELQLIASRVRSEDSELSAAERLQSKLDLKIAETQKKFLSEQQAEVKQQIESVAKNMSGQQTSDAGIAARRKELKAKEELTRDLEVQLQKLSLLLKMPPRVTKLMDATVAQ